MLSITWVYHTTIDISSCCRCSRERLPRWLLPAFHGSREGCPYSAARGRTVQMSIAVPHPVNGNSKIRRNTGCRSPVHRLKPASADVTPRCMQLLNDEGTRHYYRVNEAGLWLTCPGRTSSQSGHTPTPFSVKPIRGYYGATSYNSQESSPFALFNPLHYPSPRPIKEYSNAASMFPPNSKSHQYPTLPPPSPPEEDAHATSNNSYTSPSNTAAHT